LLRILNLLIIFLSLSSCNEKFRVEYGNLATDVFVPVPFTSVWKVGTPGFGDADLTVTLPLVTGYLYDFTVDWGDGSAVSTVTAFDDADIDHSYAAPGDYTITILGVMEAWSFNCAGDTGKITSVTDLGNTRALSLKNAFDCSNNLTSFAGGNTSKVTDMSYMFYYSDAITTLDVSSFDTSKVTNMEGMFFAVGVLTNLDLSNFDTSQVTDMSWMFAETWFLATLDISSFETSAVTEMDGMFNNAQGLTSLDLSHFDTSSVTNMSEMFLWAQNIVTLDVSNFNTSLVTNMGSMFYNMRNVISLDLSSFNTSNVTNMEWMFASTWDLVTINATGWNISAVTNSVNFYGGGNPALVVTCNQGGLPATGALFGEACF